jgi:hypothetical protein
MKRLLSSNLLLPTQSTRWLRKFPATTTALHSYSYSPTRYELNRLGHGAISGTNNRLSLKRQLSTNRSHTSLDNSTRIGCDVKCTATGGDSDSGSDNTSKRGPTQQHDNHFSLLEQYESLIQTGEITRDIHQIDALKELNRLREECISYCNKATNAQSDLESSVSTIFSQLFLSTPSWAYPSITTPSSGLPRGVYLHGGVGCGKTYCMNLFYNSLPSTIGKQKVHFHKFMLNVHKQMHLAKMKNLQGDDAIEYVIQSTLSKGQILCFDEFQVTDVADGKNMFSSHALLTCM